PHAGAASTPARMMPPLDRPLLNYWVNRSGRPNSTPGFINTGPKVALTNGQAGSGGDAFPFYFRELGLGPLIGTRTWGGLIGLSGSPSLADGGALTVRTFRFLTPAAQWGAEKKGAGPDT